MADSSVVDDDFTSRLANEIAAQASEGAGSAALHTEQAFTEWAADLLEEEGFLTDFHAAPWFFAPPGKSATMKLDGFQLDVDNGHATIVISQWNHHATGAKVTTKELSKLTSLATAFLDGALDPVVPLHSRLEPALPHAAFAEDLSKNRDEIQRLRVFIFLNELAADSELPALMLRNIPVDVTIWDARRLVRLLDGARDGRDDVVITFADDKSPGLPCIAAPMMDTKYSAYVAIISGERLASIYDAYGPRLLEANVRAYLQLTGGVNKGIRRTLINEPGSFFAYNNGLTATVDDIEIEQTASGPVIKSMRGLQIVNGAQTTGSIHRSWRIDKASLTKVFVQMKITRVGDPTMQAEVIARISEYANSQNAVKVTDLSANHPFQIRLQELSQKIWVPAGSSRWFYERTRGQYNDEFTRKPGPEQKKFKAENPPSQKLVKTDVAKLIHGWEGRPHLVSLGAQKGFVHLVDNWLKKTEDGWLPDEGFYRELIAKLILSNAALAAVHAAGIKSYYGQVAAYVFSLLAERYGTKLNLSTIWANQSVSPGLQALLQSWCMPVYNVLRTTSPKGDGDVREWAKKAGCWTHVREMELPPPAALIPELDSNAVAAKSKNVAVVLNADRETQLKVAREVTDGRVIKREDAIKELQTRFGIGRLTNERRAEFESLLDDITHLAFLDSDETTKRDAGLAVVRGVLRSGVRDRETLIKKVAAEWLDAQRVGPRVRESIDELLGTAKKRWIVLIDGDAVGCPTPTFDDYSDKQLHDVVMATVTRKNRLYSRRSVIEAVVGATGFVRQREAAVGRVEQAIESLVLEQRLEVPSEGAVRLGARG